ncbi:MAG: hypothetical protein HRT35_08645 [Algicola sp.]|nr:hypothetical protein [Algicola sp.]
MKKPNKARKPNQNDRLEQIRVLVRDNPQLTTQLIVSWIKEQDNKH